MLLFQRTTVLMKVQYFLWIPGSGCSRVFTAVNHITGERKLWNHCYCGSSQGFHCSWQATRLPKTNRGPLKYNFLCSPTDMTCSPSSPHTYRGIVIEKLVKDGDLRCEKVKLQLILELCWKEQELEKEPWIQFNTTCWLRTISPASTTAEWRQLDVERHGQLIKH
jgi:hypothetical protein